MVTVPRILERQVRSIGRSLHIPPSWQEDVRQEALLAWLQHTYDPGRRKDEILAFAYWHALHAVQEWRRRVILPANTHRGGGDQAEPRPVSYDAIGEGSDAEPPVAATAPVDLLFTPSLEEPADEADEDWFTAHYIDLPATQGNSRNALRLDYAKIVSWLSHGLSMGELAEASGVPQRTIERRVSRLRKYGVTEDCSA